jgi:PhoPQ-activated pathogenicity-related protein
VGTFVEGWDSQLHIQKIVDQDMIDKTKKLIHPDEYKQLFPEKLRPYYEEHVIDKLPAGIPKDTTVLSDIQTKRIRINESALLITKNGIGDDIIIGTPRDTTYNEKKKAILDTGKKYIEVMIPESSIFDTTKQDMPPKKK